MQWEPTLGVVGLPLGGENTGSPSPGCRRAMRRPPLGAFLGDTSLRVGGAAVRNLSAEGELQGRPLTPNWGCSEGTRWGGGASPREAMHLGCSRDPPLCTYR